MLELQPQLIGAAINHSADLILPAVAADINLVVTADGSGLRQEFPERPPLVHLVGGEDKFDPIRQTLFEGRPQRLHSGLSALSAPGDIVAEEIHVPQPHHLVAAEHRHGHQRLDRRGAKLEGALGVVCIPVDRLVSEPVVVPARQLIVQSQRLLAHQPIVAAHDHVKIGIRRGAFRFCSHRRGLARKSKLQNSNLKNPIIKLPICTIRTQNPVFSLNGGSGDDRGNGVILGLDSKPFSLTSLFPPSPPIKIKAAPQ